MRSESIQWFPHWRRYTQETLIRFMLLTTLVRFAASTDYVRGCYYTNWSQYRPGKGKYMPENYTPGLCTHIFYAFAVMTQDFQIKPFEWNDESTEWSKGMYERVNDLKKLQPGLKVLLSFGGWTFSQANLQLMSTLLASPDNRRRFIDSALVFVRKHSFDGFDIDFEYPSDKDKQNFATLIKELKEAFEKDSQRTGKDRLLLTAAVAAGFDKIDAGYDVASIAKSLDFMNVMTYDFHGAWEQVTGMNSPLYDTNGDRYAISNAMKHWAEKGAPKDKLMIGFSAYGRGWTLRNGNSTQAGAPTTGPAQALPFTREGGVGCYYEMCDLLEHGATRYQDDRTKVPCLVKGNQWFAYDDAWSFKTKLNWLKENGFGGAFTWSLDMDDFTGACNSSAGAKFPLHNLIKTELSHGKVTYLTGSAINSSTELYNETTEISSTAQVEPTTVAVSTGAFDCPGVGIYADPAQCDRFYLCPDGGVPYSLSCPPALLFNSKVSACDWPQNVHCQGF